MTAVIAMPHDAQSVRAHVGPLRKVKQTKYATKRNVHLLGGAIMATSDVTPDGAHHLARWMLQNMPAEMPIHEALHAAQEEFGAARGPPVDPLALTGGGFFGDILKGVRDETLKQLVEAVPHVIHSIAEHFAAPPKAQPKFAIPRGPTTKLSPMSTASGGSLRSIINTLKDAGIPVATQFKLLGMIPLPGH